MSNHRYVNVAFDNSRYNTKYTYRVPDRLLGKIQIGQFLIVPNTNQAFGYAIVKVDGLLHTTNVSPLKEVVTILDDSDYKTEIVNRQKKANLEKKLRERHKELMDKAWLDDLKMRDPESLNLIRELEALNNA